MKLLTGVFKLTGLSLWVIVALVLVLFLPAMLALGFTLLGIDLDWSTWKTYVGLLVISGCMSWYA